MRKISLAVVVLAFFLSVGESIAASDPPAGPALTKAEIIEAFEGVKMKVRPLRDNYHADWTLQGKRMKVLANGSQNERFSVKWEGDRMCLGNMPSGWSAKGCFVVYIEGGIYVIWKNGKYAYAKLTPKG